MGCYPDGFEKSAVRMEAQLLVIYFNRHLITIDFFSSAFMRRGVQQQLRYQSQVKIQCEDREASFSKQRVKCASLNMVIAQLMVRDTSNCAVLLHNKEQISA
jgi:hypothetical protein